MSLDREVYRTFEDIVGPGNICDDPAVLDSYAWVGQSAGVKKPYMPGDEKIDVKRFAFVRRCQAAILPGDTYQVQAIVRACNRAGIKFKAFSTGWVAGNVPGDPNEVLLDLRRMNRIIEINEKNMYAVVEPYVTSAQLQAELMKRHLNCNINGAGAHTSALPLAAFWGTGHMGQSTSNGERNLLGVEWVAPDGEVVRCGSTGSSGEWFCGDGPGPSLRGIIRGATTPLGGMGVYTRAATKVYHWPGPSTFPMEGVSPHYTPERIPENFMIRYFSFSSLEKMDTAVQKIGESAIAFSLMGFPIPMIAANMATSNEEDVRLLREMRPLVQGPGFVIIIAANSEREFRYRERVLARIITETGGESLAMMEDEKRGGAQMWRFIRISASARENMRTAGGHFGIFPGHGQFLPVAKFTQKVADMKGKLVEEGLLYDDGAHAFPWTEEHGYMGHAEVLFRFAPSHETLKGIRRLRDEALALSVDEPVGVPFFAVGDQLHDVFGPISSNYHVWLRRIKKAFDPAGVSDSVGYITAKD